MQFVCYKNAFDTNSLRWSNNEDDLYKYISFYCDLMKFWEEKLPGYIYEINYQKLIENQKGQIKKLIEFCELNWEENCLIWWDSNVLHASSNFKNEGIESKQYFITHTYV